ncbi:high affinity methionine permease [Coccidioides immitis RMSCC 3703]|uniref:High affinity methionine permease n=1 Tax=Coccidioides immitis RMSCC 3703 TaxID=454286 RepID=A0A0J8QR42_COCIT|nr:high affinity methionine permease [Coccidioides immitis RMSCC 3703]
MAHVENADIEPISSPGNGSDVSTLASADIPSNRIGKSQLSQEISPHALEKLDTARTCVSDDIPGNRRQIGVLTATFLVFNRIIGTGIFATPSTILALTGSVGMSLTVWFVGMIIAMAGTAVYLEFGTAIPVNGGEKNYLESIGGINAASGWSASPSPSLSTLPQ